MAAAGTFSATLFATLLGLLFTAPPFSVSLPAVSALPEGDVELLEFPLNLEYLEAEFFLWGSHGYGLDKVAPDLTMGGPKPIGAKKANLDPLVRDIISQFGYQEVGHVRAIKKSIKGFPRPQLDLSPSNFAKTMNSACKRTLEPPFDPYANGLNFLLASYLIPYVGLTGYVGANPKLQDPYSKRLVAGLLAVEAAQDAVIRGLLYERMMMQVEPYNITVAEFTHHISEMRNKLGGSGKKDEGIVVPTAEEKFEGNVIAGDHDSLAYERTPKEILRIVYAEGSASQPGGFFPKGADGQIATSYLKGDD